MWFFKIRALNHDVCLALRDNSRNSVTRDTGLNWITRKPAGDSSIEVSGVNSRSLKLATRIYIIISSKRTMH